MGILDYTMNTNRETPFDLAFKTETVIPLEVGLPSPWVERFDQANNSEHFRENMDLLQETWEQTHIWTVAYQGLVLN